MQKPDMKVQNQDESDGVYRTFRVGIFPVPGFALMSYASTVEPLRAANLLSRKPLYEVVHFASGEESASSGDALITQCAQVGTVMPLDLLLVVAGGDPFAFDDAPTLRWLRDMAAMVPMVGGVSGGAVLLARAGLMQGRRMTVHWEHGPEFAERFPHLMVDRRIYIIDRDRASCAGGTAPIDMMHGLIASHHGAAFARLVSDWFLHTDIRAAAAPQRALPSDRANTASPHVIEAISIMENHVADPLTLEDLAITTGISGRQLNRLFQQVMGQSAMTYYRQLRLDVGRRLVTGSAMRIDAIAQATGFASASHFSNAYQSVFGLRPREDRQGRGD